MEAVRADTLIVEILDSHGRVRARERLRVSEDKQSFSVGRSAAADVVLDDPYVAPLHMTIEITPEGALRATDLGSVNGIIVNGTRHRQAQGLELPGGLVQAGRTHLRLRTPLENLAAERPDHAGDDSRITRIAGAGALTCVLFVGYYSWLAAPWDPLTIIVINVLKLLPAAGLWIALWALVSRVIMGEWRWMTHAAILFGVSSAALIFDLALDLAWFSFAMPQWEWRNSLILVATGVAALYWHLMLGSTIRQRPAVLVAVLLPVVAIGGTTWGTMREQDRNVNYIGGQLALYPPALRVRGGGTVDDYFSAAPRLKDVADRRRKALPAEEGDEGLIDN